MDTALRERMYNFASLRQAVYSNNGNEESEAELEGAVLRIFAETKGVRNTHTEADRIREQMERIELQLNKVVASLGEQDEAAT